MIEEVEIDLWRELFTVVGWPATLVDHQSFSHADVLSAFTRDTLSDELLEALEALDVLGTSAGREAIASVMSDRRVSWPNLPASTGAREYALRLFLARRDNASLADVFARVQAQVQEGSDQRRYNEFVGKEPRVGSRLEERRRALYDAALQYCRERDLGEHMQVRAFEDDGAFVFHVIRSHHIQKPLAAVSQAARATIAFYPVHSDTIQYEFATGRLRVAARSSSIVDFYRAAFGRILFDDEEFFAGDPLYSLRCLQEKGRRAIEEHRIPGIGRAWMTECLWERGDRNLHQIRSSDCFRSIEELKLPLSEGELLQAKLKMEMAGKSTRPVTVNIRAPSRIEISQKRHEEAIRKFLEIIGVANPSRTSERVDLWSLYPWRHPVAVWRSLFGKDVDVLIRVGVLEPIQLESVASAEHEGAGRVLEARPIPGGDFVGVSSLPEIPSRSLTATDLDGLELKPERLQAHLRSNLRIATEAVPWDGEESMDLGVVELGDQRVRMTYVLRPLPAGAGDRIRTLAAGAHSVLLIPTARDDASELAKARIDRPLWGRDQVIPLVVAACGLANAVPAVFSAPAGCRLVVDKQRGQVWVDGIEITDLHPNTHPFRLVEILARKSPAAVCTSELTDELSSGRRGRDGSTTARQAKTAAVKSIRTAMTNAGREFEEDPFPSVKTGYYRCALVSHVS